MTVGSQTPGRMSQQGGTNDFQERTLIMDSLSAHFEKDHDIIGSQDPYFVLTLCGDEVKTRTIKSGGVNPVWEPEEGYRLHDRGEHPELLAHAWNKNTLMKDSSLGEGKIAMADLGSGGSHSVPLYNKKGDRTGEFKFRAKEEQGASDQQMPAAVPSETRQDPQLQFPVAPMPMRQPQGGGASREGHSGSTGMLRAGSIEPLAGNNEKTAHLHMGDRYLVGEGPTSRPYQQTGLGNSQQPQQMPMDSSRGMNTREAVGMGAGAGIMAGAAGTAGFPPRDRNPGGVQQQQPQQPSHQQGTDSGINRGTNSGPNQGTGGILGSVLHSNESHARGGCSGPSQGHVGGGDMGSMTQQTGPSRGLGDAGLQGGVQPMDQSTRTESRNFSTGSPQGTAGMMGQPGMDTSSRSYNTESQQGGGGGGMMGMMGQPRGTNETMGQSRGTNETMGQPGMQSGSRSYNSETPQQVVGGPMAQSGTEPNSRTFNNESQQGGGGGGIIGGIMGRMGQSKGANESTGQPGMETGSRSYNSKSQQSAGNVSSGGMNQGGDQDTGYTPSRVDVTGGDSLMMPGLVAAGQTETTRKVTTTEDTDRNESSEHHYKGGGGGPIQEFATGDDHWEKSLAASAEARRQAQLVERASAETHVKLLAAQEATRSFDKARREHMALEEQLAALDLEAKRAHFERDSSAYEQMSRAVSGKVRDVTTAQEAADVLRMAVNEKGEALDAEVQETKRHQSRLATLEQELARLRGVHEDAHTAHQTLMADMEPRRQKHASLTDQFHMIRSELVDYQRKRAILEMKEAELEGQLSTHNAEFEAVVVDLDDHDAMREKRAMGITDAEEETRRKQEEAAAVTATLAEHRQRIGILNQDTQAGLASAEELENEAREKERMAQMAEQAVNTSQYAMGEATADLTSAETAVKPFHEKICRETTTMDQQHEVVEEMHRKLGMAKSEVDLAQARKEELWEKAKYYGEQADKAADSHYLRATQELKAVMPRAGSIDPYRMTTQGSTTQQVLQQAGETVTTESHSSSSRMM